MKHQSKIDGYTFPYLLSDNKTYAYRQKLKGLKRIKFWLRIYMDYHKANLRLKQTIKEGVCYYGPFKGEFGHFTAHTLPFLMYLHKKGVKIIYCGMALHKPLLVDDNGRSILSEYYELRDFFSEIPPSSNNTIAPKDVQIEIDKFIQKAEASGLPFWNIGDNFYYWFIHRNWLMRGYTYTYSLDKYYKTAEEHSCVIFPRSKGSEKSHNNGERWDYQDVIDTVKPYFDVVYIAGHPSQSLDIKEQNKVVLKISDDNKDILEACSNASLIITQHSGVNNLGEYTNTPVLIIYKGGNKVEDIGSMNNTLRFRKALNQQYPLSFAFNLDQIRNFVKELNKNE